MRNNLKKTLLTGAVALSLIGTCIASTTSQSTVTETKTIVPAHHHTLQPNQCHTMHHSGHHHFHHKGHPRFGNVLLTKAQRAEMRTIVHAMFEEMRPLLKTKHALQLQLMGKVATPNMQWSEVAGLLNAINQNNARITTLFAKTQFTTFQKLGVTLPLPHTNHGVHAHRIA